jgi:TonB-linked SusC/RagA family outer membrane protein
MKRNCMINGKRALLTGAVFVLASLSVLVAQVVEGVVLGPDKTPVVDAVVGFPGSESVRTDNKRGFNVNNPKQATSLTVWASGYFEQAVPVKGQDKLTIYLIPEDKLKYNQTTLLPYRKETGLPDNLTAKNVSKKDVLPGSMSLDKALQGEVPGLLVTNKSGMTGEGAYFNLRGLRSLLADNAPLVVLNGIPLMPDKNESRLIGGYSRSIFQALNVYDIQDVTLLKGAETALYGSLGANGVLLIETDGAASDDLNTKISYYGQVGMNWNNKRLPMLNTKAYKSYLSDIGMTYYNDMEVFFANFPFLSDPDNNYAYLYNHNTDWQGTIQSNSLVTDHLFRVEGGDAIAKYDLSLGYMRDNGTILNTSSSRYHTQLNTNVLVSKSVEITTTIGLAYLAGDYQEQGMSAATNPLLSALSKAPILSPYKYDIHGNQLDAYANYYYGASTNMDFTSSNPLAIVNILNANNRQYDINAKVALTYKPTTYFSMAGNIGFYYNYDQESLFVPGVNNQEILPQSDRFGTATNLVKVGVAETFNQYYGLNAAYKRMVADKHAIHAMVGTQLLTTHNEFDAGSGRNTPNDFYQTLGDVNSIGRYFFGYVDVWSWMNYYVHMDHTYDNLLKTSFNLSIDGASSTGSDAPRFGWFPSLGLTFMAKNTGLLSTVSAINALNIKADYGLTGNSRFSSNYGKYYYTSQPYQGIAGIIRANVPNTNLKWEENRQFNLGVDAALFRNRLDVAMGYYNTQASDVLMISPNSSVYGTGVYYSNDAALSSDGIEASFQFSPVLTKTFSWVIGGNLATLNNSVKSLGSRQETLLTLTDGAQLITRVGEHPYAYYGYQTNGVFASTSEAQSADLTNLNGVAYEAGDVRFVDQNNDHVINEKDKVLLGSATPDLFGGFYNRFAYRGFALDVNLAFSLGNEAYNAVRRNLESASDFSNQSQAVVRRWTMEDQVTDMPRAVWGDPVGNNGFSDRWIEDASYLKVRDITLSYTFKNPLWQVFQSGMVYVSGQNLFTLTRYLGLDPEFSYSYSDALQGVDYAKIPQPKTIKVGVNLKF